MISLQNIRDFVVSPALTAIGHNEAAAVRLVIGTGLVESNYEYLAQKGGPAVGFWQMEAATADDIFTNYLPSQPILRTNLLCLTAPYGHRTEQLAWNLQYAAALCRIKYLRSPHSLPHEDDLEGMAQFWKLVYNTSLGAGDPAVFVERATAAGLMNL